MEQLTKRLAVIVKCLTERIFENSDLLSCLSANDWRALGNVVLINKLINLRDSPQVTLSHKL